jgi:hypothetical protein
VTKAALKKLVVVITAVRLVMAPTLAYAENTSNVPDAVQQQLDQLQQTLQKNATNNSASPAPNFQTPQMQAQDPTPPQSSDRSNKNGMAKAMAMLGAGMAFMSCAMLMKAAAEEEDPSTKALMQSMAMQQCGQGAQDMANAAQQDKDKNKLTQDSTPKMSQLSAANNQPTASKDNGGNTTPTIPTTPTDTSTDPAPTTPDAPVAKAPPSTPTNLVQQPLAAQGDAYSVPDAIDPAKLKFDESAKPTAVSANGNPGGGTLLDSPGGNRSPSGTEDDLKNKLPSNNEANGTAVGRKGKYDLIDPGSPGTGSDEASGGKAGGSDALSGMLSQLLGGGAMPEMMGFMSGGEMNDPAFRNKSSKPTINIFQFARKCYHRLSHADGRIRLRPPIGKAKGKPNDRIAEAAF